jgi:hypothetical protein
MKATNKYILLNFTITIGYILIVFIMFRNRSGGDIIFVLFSAFAIIIHVLIILFRRKYIHNYFIQILIVLIGGILLMMVFIESTNQIREKKKFEILKREDF